MIPFKLTCTPKEHQKKIVEFILNHPNSIIASETGSGKTLMCYMEAMVFLAQDKVDKVLTIVTKKSKHSYEVDAEKLTDIDINNQIQVIYTMEDIWEFYENPKKIIGIVQYENFKTIDKIHWEDLFKRHRVLVQLDEFHKAKTPMSELYIPKTSSNNDLFEKPTKTVTKLNEYLYSLRPLMTYMTGFTATPLTSNTDLSDMFWLATLTQPGIFNDSLLDFYNNYIRYSAYLVPIRKGSSFKRTVVKIYGYKNTDILVEKLKTICFNYFPKKDIVTRKFWYNPTEVMGEYKKAVQGVLDTYNERKIDEDTGDIIDKDFSARMLDAQYVLNNSYAKKECLLQALKETISKGVLIYCNYYNTVDAVEYVLSNAHIPYKEISGKTSDKDCKKIMEWFNESPENKVVILTSAGAQSINLQSTDSMIFYDLPYTCGGLQQALGRIIRLGSKYDKFYMYVIVSENTIDEYKYEYLTSSIEMIRYIQGNPNFFSDEPTKSPNTEIMKKMRNTMLWNKFDNQ